MGARTVSEFQRTGTSPPHGSLSTDPFPAAQSRLGNIIVEGSSNQIQLNVIDLFSLQL